MDNYINDEVNEFRNRMKKCALKKFEETERGIYHQEKILDMKNNIEGDFNVE